VLESRHVIGLFLLMLVFSGVFFTLGYVMGRNQYDGQVRASTSVRPTTPAVSPKPEPTAKRGGPTPSSNTDPSSDISPQPNSEWSFYDAGKASPPDDRLKPVPVPRTVSTAARGKGSRSESGPLISSGTYTLQVAALRREADAMTLASHLQKKRFPAFVVSPQGDKYYRVQVGPYTDQKSAEAARKGLEGAGFKAIVKH
jgi:septal ring-binding cell division protein DamX